MRYYKRQLKYIWWGYNDRGNPPKEKETKWMDEDEALALNIRTYEGCTSCIEYERFVEVDV